MSTAKRNSRTFKLNAEELIKAQSSPTASDLPAALTPYSQIDSATPLLPKPLRRALVALGSVVCIIIAADIVSLVNQLNNLHRLAGVVAGMILGGLSLYGLLGLHRWVRGIRTFEQMEVVRAKASELRSTGTQEEKQQLQNALLNYYVNKPQEGALRAALDSLPDYSTGKELVEHLERSFLAPIDQQADKLIQLYSLQTGLSVAASPFPALDILLTLWRCQILISEIAELYGIQPSLANRSRILVRVLRAMAYSGLTETSIGLADLSNIPLGQFGARTAQGLGAAVASARLGLVTARLSRPIPAVSDEKTVFKKLASAILLLLGKKILGRSD